MDYVLESFKHKEVRINMVGEIELLGFLRFDGKAPFVEVEDFYRKDRVYFNPAQLITINEIKG